MPPSRPASLLTLFGATGDLARRMLLPSLYGLEADGLLPAGMRILGTARSELDREGFINLVTASLKDVRNDDAALRGLIERLDYRAAGIDDAASMQALAEAITALRSGDGVPGPDSHADSRSAIHDRAAAIARPAPWAGRSAATSRSCRRVESCSRRLPMRRTSSQ